jgi:hypothetical protein
VTEYETEYACLTEHNEWEGETWHFYIPLVGNEDALTTLREMIEDDESYELSTNELGEGVFTESEVDILVKHGGDTDYMAAHSRLAGRLLIPDRTDLDKFYKGGIKDLMTGD